MQRAPIEVDMEEGVMTLRTKEIQNPMSRVVKIVLEVTTKMEEVLIVEEEEGLVAQE